MRRLLYIVALLISLVGGSLAQPSIVASTLGQCLASTTAITTGSACGGSSIVGSAINTTGASLLFACKHVYNPNASTLGNITDSKSNTWTNLTPQVQAGNYSIQAAYAIPSSSSQVGTSHTFTLASSGTGSFNTLSVVAAVGTAGATTYRTGTYTTDILGNDISVTPTAIHDLLLSCISDDISTAKTINGGFTVLQSTTTTANGETGGIAWLDPGSTSAQTWKWTTNQAMTQIGVAFGVGPTPSAPAGTPVKRRVIQ